MDCCASSVIPGNSAGPAFYRSYDGVSAGYTSKAYPATVSDFRLDKYEITVGRFRNFVAAYSQNMIPAGAGKNPNNPSDTGWNTAWNALLPADQTALIASLKCHNVFQTWTDSPVSPTQESTAIDCLDWYDSVAFCIWDGGRLPTEAEWNYAAAGGTEQRVYPWSNPPTSTTIDATYAVYDTGCADCANYVGLVGQKSPLGDAKWGQADMAGNASEWVLDGFADPYGIIPCNNCAELGVTSFRMKRGGQSNSFDTVLLTSARANGPPSNTDATGGARCARAP
jgi:formylglycine-generating enzyme required for sulfatase activity